ncbi:MAG: septation protein SpoVG family protein [Candidatus Omnitrophota bacterium]
MTGNNINVRIARMHKVDGNNRVKAFVDMNIADLVVVKGLRVVDGPKGLFVAMPQQKGKDKKWYDTIRCLSRDVRFAISQQILDVYQGKDS